MLKMIEGKFSHRLDGSIYKVVGEYEFDIARETLGEQFKVKVLKGSDGLFHCKMSHYVHRSGLAGPHYVSLHGYSSEEEALSEVFMHGLMNFDKNDVGVKWQRNVDY